MNTQYKKGVLELCVLELLHAIGAARRGGCGWCPPRRALFLSRYHFPDPPEKMAVGDLQHAGQHAALHAA